MADNAERGGLPSRFRRLEKRFTDLDNKHKELLAEKDDWKKKHQEQKDEIRSLKDENEALRKRFKAEECKVQMQASSLQNKIADENKAMAELKKHLHGHYQGLLNDEKTRFEKKLNLKSLEDETKVQKRIQEKLEGQEKDFERRMNYAKKMIDNLTQAGHLFNCRSQEQVLFRFADCNCMQPEPQANTKLKEAMARRKSTSEAQTQTEKMKAEEKLQHEHMQLSYTFHLIIKGAFLSCDLGTRNLMRRKEQGKQRMRKEKQRGLKRKLKRKLGKKLREAHDGRNRGLHTHTHQCYHVTLCEKY